MPGKPVPHFVLARTGGTSPRPSAAEHFKQKLRFPFELLARPDEARCKQLALMKQNWMYGKKARSIEWRGVKIRGHAQEVFNFAKAL